MRLKIFLMMLFSLFFSLMPQHPMLAQDPTTQTYIADNGVFSLDFPAEWSIRPSYQDDLLIGNESAAIDAIRSQSPLNDDQTVLFLLGKIALTERGLSNNADSLDAVLDFYLQYNPPDTVTGAREPLSIGQYQALRLPATLPYGDVHYYAIQSGDDFLVALAAAAHDKLAEFTPLHESILATLQTNIWHPFARLDDNLSFQVPPMFSIMAGEGAYRGFNSGDIFNYDYPYDYTLKTDHAAFDFYTPANWPEEIGIPFNPTLRLDDLALAFAYSTPEIYAQRPEKLTLGILTPITFGDYAGMRVDYHIENKREGFAAVFDVQGIPTALVTVTALNELPNFEEVFTQMAASVRYIPRARPLHSNARGDLPFDEAALKLAQGNDLWTFSLSDHELLQIEFPPDAESYYANILDSAEFLVAPVFYVGSTAYFYNGAAESYILQVTDSLYPFSAHKITPQDGLSLGTNLTVELSATNPSFLSFDGQAGQIIEVQLQSAAPLPNLRLLGAKGLELYTGYTANRPNHYRMLLPYTGSYLLMLTGAGEAENTSVALTLSELTALPLEIGTSLSGDYAGNGQALYYSIAANAGDKLSIAAFSEIFLPHLRLFRETGFELPLGDGFSELTNFDYTIPATGRYILSVGTLYDYHSGEFSLSIISQ